MANRSVDTSPQVYARIAGILYLYIIVAGSFAEIFVRSRLVISNDATSTAINIMSNELLFRIGFSAELVHLTFDVVIAVILYALLRSVDRYISLLAALTRVACDIILAVASISHFAALKLLAEPEYLKTFQTDQLHSLALLAMRLHGDGYAISLVFFSFTCFSLGYLIIKSSFFPRTIGGLLVIAGICYLLNSFAHFLNPTFAATLFPVMFVPIFIAELSFTLWMIVKGVDVAKWKEALAISLHTAPK
jgi:hypothetical protein